VHTLFIAALAKEWQQFVSDSIVLCATNISHSVAEPPVSLLSGNINCVLQEGLEHRPCAKPKHCFRSKVNMVVPSERNLPCHKTNAE